LPSSRSVSWACNVPAANTKVQTVTAHILMPPPPIGFVKSCPDGPSAKQRPGPTHKKSAFRW
jgi:hypothetical protein